MPLDPYAGPLEIGLTPEQIAADVEFYKAQAKARGEKPDPAWDLWLAEQTLPERLPG